MAAEIRVDTIKGRSGINTFSFKGDGFSFDQKVGIGTTLASDPVKVTNAGKLSVGVVSCHTIFAGIVTGPGAGVGIKTAGGVIGYGFTTLNFIGSGNTFATSGNTVDISIAGGGGGGGSGCKQYVSGSYDEGKGGIGGNGQGYNQSQTNAPSSSIQQGGNGGTYGNDGVRGTGDGIGIPTSYGDRIRNQSFGAGGFKYNHRKYNFKRSPILSHDGGQAGFIVTSANNNAVEFFNNGTRGGRL